MDALPPEVILVIFKNLDFKEVAALRLSSRRCAELGAEFLITKVCFHAAKDSLERLSFLLSKFSKTIDTVVYEGNTYAERTLEQYKDHFLEHHHADSAPVKPADDAPARDQRLYKRNKAKYDAAVLNDYNNFQKAYRGQQAVLTSATYANALSCLRRLPKLRHLTLTTGTRCIHSMSRRYQKAFPMTCTMPTGLCSKPTITQLRRLLIPNGPLLGLQSLTVHNLSPNFFRNMSIKTHVLNVFKSLQTIRLTLRMEESQREDLQIHGVGPHAAYKTITQGYLHEALAAAQGATSILINFDDLGYYGPATTITAIIGNTVWPKLVRLDLDCIKFTQKQFLDTLKRQPKLSAVFLGFAFLLDSDWPTLLKKLKNCGRNKSLALDMFETMGLLEDSDNCYPVSQIDAGAYADERMEIILSNVINDFVTTEIWDDDDEEFCPINSFDWQEPDELYHLYGGPESDFDYEDDIDSDSDGSESEATPDLPDLEPMDIDDGAPVKQEEDANETGIPELVPMQID
ncbi:uncharacterized protein AB675_5104 [Cyphellophora attinorum]|uniref:F-box domain-containing protein n=1 Tax=Cyphellophora attinorum TaxID=1664694 RepID=A0A0N1H7U6_9EURO|nr:uncharacterized protein AB675_5104 [Phialophora attinorum]KPI39224.1 hypothetical protein AB675_5104 [Phialophora attinorum]